MRIAHFFAENIRAEELDALLAEGWRRFGIFYFRPFCENCAACIPVRIPVETFVCSASQKKNIRKNSTVRVVFRERIFSAEIYEMYSRHSLARFGRADAIDQFFESFYFDSCPALESNYFIGDRLAGVGFLDQSSRALSSCYFFFEPDFTKNGLGIFSILREIEHTGELGLQYYYLGYYVEGNKTMHYKSRFFPHERFDWSTGRWRIKEKVMG